MTCIVVHEVKYLTNPFIIICNALIIIVNIVLFLLVVIAARGSNKFEKAGWCYFWLPVYRGNVRQRRFNEKNGVHGQGLPVKIQQVGSASGLSLSESKPTNLLKFEGNAIRCEREVQFLCFLVG